MSWFSLSSLVARSAVAKPATRLYPFERREPYARTRGHIEFVIDSCTFCNICAHKCPTDAIVVNKKERVWAIDHTRCILCGNCVDDCRRGCISLSRQPHPPLLDKHVQEIRENFQAPAPIVAADHAGCCQNDG
jgi:ech hydrogenase subunit F